VRRLAGITAVTCAALATSPAAAGPFFTSSLPRLASPGALVTLRAGMGVRVGGALPLYLVRVRLAPRPYRCHDGSAYCEPTVRRAPSGSPYLRIGSLDVRHARGSPVTGYSVSITYRVPKRAAPGGYAYVLYCRWCAPKGEGSLIAWPTLAWSGHPRFISIGAGLIVR
jgi:hypothetical protein